MIRSFIINNGGIGRLRTQEFPSQKYEPDAALKNSFFGTPVWGNLKFPAGNYETLDGEIIEFEGIEIDEVLISVSMQKNVVTTAIMGRNGTVKEYVSDGDYSITIQGALASNENDNYPVAKFASLLEILKAPVSVKVESEFLAQFDIDEIVIVNYDFPQSEGFRDLQYFGISAVSDEPIELRDNVTA